MPAEAQNEPPAGADQSDCQADRFFDDSTNTAALYEYDLYLRTASTAKKQPRQIYLSLVERGGRQRYRKGTSFHLT